MKIIKKIMNISLVLAICFSMIGNFVITANALTTKTYTTMDSIPENLIIFQTMAYGSITPVNVSGV